MTESTGNERKQAQKWTEKNGGGPHDELAARCYAHGLAANREVETNLNLLKIMAMPLGPDRLRARIKYLQHCYAVDPISLVTRIQLSNQIDDLKKQLVETEDFTLATAERRAVERALNVAKTKKGAALLLGIGTKCLRQKIVKHEIADELRQRKADVRG